MNEDYYHEQNSCYDSNSFGFDQVQPPQYTVNHPIFNSQNDLLNSQNKLMEQMTTLCDMVGQIMQKKEEEKRIAEEQASKDRYWKIPICYDDDEDDTIAITPVLPIEEPDNSLSMGDEHLDTIPATESDEVIKSSVEDLIVVNSNDDNSSSDDDSTYGEDIEYVDASPPDVEIVSLEVVEIVDPEVGRIDDDILLTIKDDILREKLLNVNLLIAKIDALKDNPAPSSEVVIKSTSTFPNLFLEETNTFDNSIPESETFRFNLEEISSGSPTTHSELSLPDYKAFYVDNDHFKERSSGSTTTHVDFSQYDSFIFDLSNDQFPPTDRSDLNHEEFADELAHIISPPEYDHFCFKIEPELGNLTMDVVNDIFPTREPRVHVPNVLPTHLTLDTDFILLSEPLFAYIVWIFLPFLTYPVAPPYLLSCGNEDIIFDPGISKYHSFMPDVSHRSGTFIKFNVHPNHLNESCSNKEWLVQGGTALGKDIIKSVDGCDDLPKIIRECGASESAGVYVSSLHSQHICSYAHMLVKCFAAVPISIPSGRTFIVPAGRYVVPAGRVIISFLLLGVISEETEKSKDDWDHLLDIDFRDIPEINKAGLLPFICKMGKSKRNKKKAIENFQLYYSDVGPSLSNGKPLTQEEAAREALAIDIYKRFYRLEEERPEKEDPGAFIILIRLESKIELNALADTGSDINVMLYRIYAKLGREEVKKVNQGITMLNHSKAKLMGVQKDVLCQVGVTTIIEKFLILGMPIDRDAPILVGRGFLYTYGSILNTRDRITYTFDGVCHQTFRVAKTSLNTEESDNDDEEDYGIQKNSFGAPMYGPKPARYLNCNNLMDRALALQEVINPFRKIMYGRKL
ncbi:putative reverse transcriptase domain-containing protein [Tanacetum coccineum]